MLWRITPNYRVGTLGQENFFQIANTVHKLLRKKNLKKFVLIGDFNLPGIPWGSVVDRVTEPIKTSFINSFAENGLKQCITESTHRAGNILDLLLSTSINSIINLKVNDTPLCKSDYFSITFEVELKVKRRKPIKRKFFNFKKADWENLNTKLASIDWYSLLDSRDPNESWKIFTSVVHHHLTKIYQQLLFKVNSILPGLIRNAILSAEKRKGYIESSRLQSPLLTASSIPAAEESSKP